MTASRPTPGELVAAALAYADRGWPVLPVVPQGKRPLAKQGSLDATCDPHQIGEWWTRWPSASVGLRTGVLFDVLDVDGPEGRHSIEEVAGPEWDHSGPISRTGRGQHWLFAESNTANGQRLWDKVDWRGTNGYIVAPPSVHHSGSSYAWDPEHGPDTPLPEVPDWLAPLLKPWVDKEEPSDHTIRVLKTNPYSSHAPQRILAYGAERIPMLLDSIVEYADSAGLQPRPDGGGRYSIHCPFHEGDNEASMKLYPRDNSFYCFGCGAWGDTNNLRDLRPGGSRASG